MQVDFFKFTEKVEPVKEFGLVDNAPAEVNYDETQKDSWNAIVKCNKREDYHFAPLDKKIKIMESFNKEESLCECLLNTKEAIAFVELKERKKQHTKQPVEQLENTIRLFKQNHNIDNFIFKKAFICNRKRPYYNEAKNSVCTDFATRNGVALHIGIEIGEME